MAGICADIAAGNKIIAVIVTILAGSGLVAPSTSFALAEGRSYEMASPIYKGGYGVGGIAGVAPDGESVAFRSQAAFSGALYAGLDGYVARRGASGWSTFPLEAPPSLIFPNGGTEPTDFSANLETALLQGKPGPNLGARSKTEDVFLLYQVGAPDEAGNFEVLGEPLKRDKEGVPVDYSGGSPDFSHIMFRTNNSEPLLPEAVEGEASQHQLYDLARTGANRLRLVGLNEEKKLIDPSCSVALGTEHGKGSTFNAVADDGEEIFFTTAANSVEGSKCGVPTNPDGLYVRIGGETTLRVSPPPSGGEGPSAEFQGANESGTCAFFTTSQPLVSEDADRGNDLYVARIGHLGEARGPCAPRGSRAPSSLQVSSLDQLSHDPHPGQAAEVQGVVAISGDGSHVYFVAKGVLSERANVEGSSAIAGADNMYVAETEHLGLSPTFVADLCSGSEISGDVRDASCPTNIGEASEADESVWLGGGTIGPPQMAAEGRFLLFSTRAKLLSNDTDTARDLYRYDAVVGQLVRVTEGESGYGSNGNSDSFETTLRSPPGLVSGAAGIVTRAINETGSRIVFTTSDPLSRDATNGLSNAYEWHMEPGWNKAVVSLISSGDDSEPVTDVVMSSDGGNVFFITAEGLVPQDVDSASDVYDARVGGGFPPPSAARQPCSGDACQGALTAPQPLLVPGSISQAPGNNFPPSKPLKIAKKKAKARHRLAHRRKRNGKNARRGVAGVGSETAGRSGR